MHCKQARQQIAAMPQPAKVSPTLTQHAAQCTSCAKLLAERTSLHNALANLRAETTALGPSDSVEMNVLVALSASQFNPRPTAHTWRWVTVSALSLTAIVVAALLFTVLRTHNAPPVARADAPFTMMPYVIPPAPYERTAVVRTQVSMQIMQSAGFQVHGEDLSSTTLADVIYGEDGRILALRLVSESNPASDKRID